ncbi:ADP-dependent NAD(P)H-hydrate dehydratase [Microbacterium excoecariae]|uniref:ADP-dependent NAD(P)H-hydrate dehydratase n=1 Tax=Microbacterium excoecariae TaxID=2715210 RepID=UPI00140B31E6|nr:ADP/ATP-dependent (S)-NAD(P)H-hydrate dehydratase [Microbacterium excoecariae]NHI17926.1 NAD(P)H-hydrate dehydratase [Microbacterium excoecariae]
MPGGFEWGDNEWVASDAASVLRVPTHGDHKYSRGVVSLLTGSEEFPGAAVLSVEGATRAGVGMVRWFGPDPVGQLVLQRRPETVTEAGRTDAIVVGSGIDGRTRDEAATRTILGMFALGAPVVIDAGALDLAPRAVGPFVVTPHDRELREVRIPLGLGVDDIDVDPLQDRLDGGFRERVLVARETAVGVGGVVLLKGAETIVATPGGWWTVVRTGTPWLATAGTGDVLAGAIGAILAGAAARDRAREVDVEELGPIAATAAWLHGTAGRIAAGPGRPIAALDVAEALPAAFAEAFA